MKTQVLLVIALLWTAVLSRPSAPAPSSPPTPSSAPSTPEKHENKGGWFSSFTGAVNKGYHDVVGVFTGGSAKETTTEAAVTSTTVIPGVGACSSAALASLACG